MLPKNTPYFKQRSSAWVLCFSLDTWTLPWTLPSHLCAASQTRPSVTCCFLWSLKFAYTFPLLVTVSPHFQFQLISNLLTLIDTNLSSQVQACLPHSPVCLTPKPFLFQQPVLMMIHILVFESQFGIPVKWSYVIINSLVILRVLQHAIQFWRQLFSLLLNIIFVKINFCAKHHF